MTPSQKLRHEIIHIQANWGHCEKLPEGITGEEVDKLYLSMEGDLQDARNEVRCGGTETGLRTTIPPGYHQEMRNYEYDEVAYLTTGGWVGFTYWYGGGKHSEPSAIEWIEFAYNLDVREEQKMVTIQTFTKPEPR